MPSSSAFSSLVGKLCKASSPSPALAAAPRCISFSSSSSAQKAKSKKADSELKTSKQAKPSDSKSEPEPKPKPKLAGGAQLVYRVSSSLAAVLQTSETTRPDALKRIWDYIKVHKLQSSTERSQIMCDPVLKKAFGQDNLKVSEVLKYLSPHLSRKV